VEPRLSNPCLSVIKDIIEASPLKASLVGSGWPRYVRMSVSSILSADDEGSSSEVGGGVGVKNATCTI
jgi:hypothetical protein